VADPEEVSRAAGEHSHSLDRAGVQVYTLFIRSVCGTHILYMYNKQLTVCTQSHAAERKEASVQRERESVLISEEHPTSHGASGGKGVQKGSQSRRTRPPNQHTHIHTLTRLFLLARCRREVSVCCFLACASRGPEFGMIPYTACVGIRSGKKKTFRAEAQRWQVVHPANAELIITQVSARAN
jgi:hypothetical protein